MCGKFGSFLFTKFILLKKVVWIIATLVAVNLISLYAIHSISNQNAERVAVPVTNDALNSTSNEISHDATHEILDDIISNVVNESINDAQGSTKKPSLDSGGLDQTITNQIPSSTRDTWTELAAQEEEPVSGLLAFISDPTVVGIAITVGVLVGLYFLWQRSISNGNSDTTVEELTSVNPSVVDDHPVHIIQLSPISPLHPTGHYLEHAPIELPPHPNYWETLYDTLMLNFWNLYSNMTSLLFIALLHGGLFHLLKWHRWNSILVPPLQLKTWNRRNVLISKLKQLEMEHDVLKKRHDMHIRTVALPYGIEEIYQSIHINRTNYIDVLISLSELTDLERNFIQTRSIFKSIPLTLFEQAARLEIVSGNRFFLSHTVRWLKWVRFVIRQFK